MDEVKTQYVIRTNSFVISANYGSQQSLGTILMNPIEPENIDIVRIVASVELEVAGKERIVLNTKDWNLFVSSDKFLESKGLSVNPAYAAGTTVYLKEQLDSNGIGVVNDAVILNARTVLMYVSMCEGNLLPITSYVVGDTVNYSVSYSITYKTTRVG